MAPTIPQLRILNGVLCGIALLVTAFRLYLRYTRSKLWWDDFWVVVSALFVIGLIVVNFLHTANPADYSQQSKIAVYYMCIQFYYAVSWTSRLSILFTVIRFTFERMRRFLVLSAAAFLVAWAVLFAQVFWVCATGDQTWKSQPIPQCDLGTDVAVAQVICVIVSDTILVFAPIKLVLGVRLPTVTKVRLVSVFASTVVTTAVSLYYIHALLRVGGLTEEWAATIHDGVCLLVANLTVVVAFFFHLFDSSTGGIDESSHDNTRPLHHTFVRNKQPRSAFNLSTTIRTARAEDVEQVYHEQETPSDTLWNNSNSDVKTLKLHSLPTMSDPEILALDK